MLGAILGVMSLYKSQVHPASLHQLTPRSNAAIFGQGEIQPGFVLPALRLGHHARARRARVNRLAHAHPQQAAPPAWPPAPFWSGTP